MASISVDRTELVWPGKYNDDGTLKEVPRVSLPFQVIETVNESRATREARRDTGMPLFDEWEGNEGDSFEEGWRNKLIWGDNLLVMGSLLKRFAGTIDLIYIDPPFATGADFSFSAPVGESGESAEKQASAIEEKAYRDTWGAGVSSWISMLYERLIIMRDLLSPTGSIYIHVDPRTQQFVRGVCDSVFGNECFRNIIVWKRDVAGKGGKKASRQWPRNADTIVWYSRSSVDWTFHQQYTDLRPEQKQPYRYEDDDGRLYKAVQLGNYTEASIMKMEASGLIHVSSTGKKYKKYYLDEARSTVDCIWTDIHGFGTSTASQERVGYPTQKPESLLERIINSTSSPNDLVADFFCGSGTTCAVAERLGRRWIGCDLGRWGIHVTRKRMLGIEKCKPFELLNLGKYERQYWSGVAFGDGKDEKAYFEYIAFILKLYAARPVPGMAYLHGRKSGAMVHVGAVDAPVTTTEIQSAIEECTRIGQSRLHVLGWEWEMGLANLMVAEAKKQGVSLRLLQIPREVMEQQVTGEGDVRFFELAYVETEVQYGAGAAGSRKIFIHIRDFVVPSPKLIPDDVRDKIKKWSDYIDYWAVDWDFANDTFMQGWVAYRTRKERTLPLRSDAHEYEGAGRFRVLVKVIDIFGNDTSQIVDVEIQ